MLAMTELQKKLIVSKLTDRHEHKRNKFVILRSQCWSTHSKDSKDSKDNMAESSISCGTSCRDDAQWRRS